MPNKSLSRIKGEDRLNWLDVIRAYQPVEVGKALYICDLHFRPNDLLKNGKYLRPKKQILPHLKYVYLNLVY